MNFTIEIIQHKEITELPSAWNNLNYKELLEIMEYGDTSDLSDGDLKEMCLMSLSDLEPEDAATHLLTYIFEGRLNAGQIHNLSHEMQDDKMWEEYADLFLHEEFFNVGQLLYEAYNGKFPHPEAMKFIIKVQSNEASNLEIFDLKPESALLKLIVQGMPDNTLIKRLFKDELEDEVFKQANDILWQLQKEITADNTVQFEIISSEYWLHDLKYAKSFSAALKKHI